MSEWKAFNHCATWSGKAEDFIQILLDYECPNCGSPNFGEWAPKAGWSKVLLCVDCDHKWNGKYSWYRKKVKDERTDI